MSRQNTKAKKPETGPDHRLPHLRFYSDEFVFDTVSGMFYRLSPSAGFLLRALDEKTGLEQLVDKIQQKYGVDRLKAVRDVELFLNDLATLGIFNPSDLSLPAEKKE